MHMSEIFDSLSLKNITMLSTRRRIFVIITLRCFSLAIAFSKADDNPDISLTTPELVTKYKYPLEIHDVLTADGYILQLHRIPRPRNDNKANSRIKAPILLMHGMGGSSAGWVLMGPGKSLAYVLADAGYDVWLGNNRGNIYSKNHTSLSPSDRTFWNFSYHEFGIYDLPAIIDYISNTTRHERILYVGHSEGTTQFWVMASEKPEYNSKIILMIALAPAAFTANIRGPITKLAKLTYLGVWIGETFGYPEFGSRSDWGKFVSNLFCQNAAPTQFICSNLLFLIAGFSREELNTENLTVIIGHVPAGASWKQFVHYGQGYINGHFSQYDYGNDEKNLQEYNSTTPPDYQLEKITTPIALFSSDNDWLATTKDVELLAARLNSVVLHYKIPMNNFNHYDFIWGKSSLQMVSRPILQLLAQYQ
ncbi:lipase 3-like [Odontomachus brunneus]|uniref:lipase 3-like n=1 Tax=Odontomachus brunneus TaxID=486640 RepID=UPI0013F1BFA4|nr:lipase 3-like [Odontomachus brunneus]XP_032663800.1 lipase 3-like [Odontomachus brunneus]XP_032663801.1 lipase 3-like [Odontomachus brunneus]XP_032663802.1 lipase 3-like [Odontomachus brunneus]XP_032663803.1 lipase 3-like [Odontomachus brunneus]